MGFVRLIAGIAAVMIGYFCLVAPAEALQSQLWTVKVTAKPTRAESPKLLSGMGTGQSEAYSGLGGLVNRVKGEVGLPIQGESFAKAYSRKTGAYSLDASDTIAVSIECKGPLAVFQGTLKGELGASTSFEDGGNNVVDSTVGTGLAKLGVVGLSSGDLTYDANTPLKPIALGSFDNKGLFQADLDVNGQKITIKPEAGDGENSDAQTGGGRNADPVTKKKYAFTLVNATHSDIKVDNSWIGSAQAATNMKVIQQAHITGNECQMGTLSSTVDLDLSVSLDGDGNPQGNASVKIVTKDGPNVVETIDTDFPPIRQASYRRVKRSAGVSGVEADNGWGGAAEVQLIRSGARSLARAATRERARRPQASRARQIDAPIGTTVVYRVEAPGSSPLGRVRTLRLRLERVSQRTGEVLFRARVQKRRQRSAGFNLTGNAYTGEDGIRGILVPSGLNDGDRVLKIGKVLSAKDDEVHVRFREDGSAAAALYDRDTGFLRRIKRRGQGKPFEMTLIDAR